MKRALRTTWPPAVGEWSDDLFAEHDRDAINEVGMPDLSLSHYSGITSFHGWPGGRPTRSSWASSRSLLGISTDT